MGIHRIIYYLRSIKLVVDKRYYFIFELPKKALFPEKMRDILL
jgi:hypothetical protein